MSNLKLTSAASLRRPGVMQRGKALHCWFALGLALVGLNFLAMNGSWPSGSAGGAHFAIALAPGNTPTPGPAVDAAPPSQPVKLIFIQPAGDDWLPNVNGGLGIALRDNNYYVSNTGGGWGPYQIGDRTDIGSWWEWFRGPDSAFYLPALYAESGKNVVGLGNYSRLPSDPGGENEVVVFASGGNNSALGGPVTGTIPSIDQNLLRGAGTLSDEHTLTNAKGIYVDLLNYFRQHPEKLFILVTAPPLLATDTDPDQAANARALNTWLVTEWLRDYPYPNVAVFDLFNVLTGTDNHHRYTSAGGVGKIEYIADPAHNYYADSYYDPTQRYPDRRGNQKATSEFVPLLNAYYNRWKHEDQTATPTPTAVSVPHAAGDWSTPIQFSGFGWWPDVAADGSGRVHVVWSTGSEGYDTVAYTTSQNGLTWSDAIDIAARPGTGYATRPTLLVDHQGSLLMTYRDSDIYFSQVPLASAASPRAWRPPSLISDLAYYSRMAVDDQNRLHMIYTAVVNAGVCQACSHVFYRRSEDNGQTWSSPIDIFRQTTSLDTSKTQLLVDKQGGLHAVWDLGPTAGAVSAPSEHSVLYTASYDGGETWADPVTMASEAQHITIGQDGGGHLVVAWLNSSNYQVYSQVSSDRGHTWSPAKPVPGAWGGLAVYGTWLDDYSMATDSAGTVHLVMVGHTYLQRSLSVLHLAWNGSGWSVPERLATFQGDVPEWPRVAVGNGNRLHVVWFVRDEAEIWSGGGRYRVWYMQSLTSAPAATPAVYPTFTFTPPAPTATQTPVAATATPLPMPTETLSVAEPGTVVYSESQYLPLIARSLAPVLIIVTCVAGLVVLWRRNRP
jgi:hypothetical protein